MLKATCVIIGAGVTGCSIAYNLAELGLKEIAQLVMGKAPFVDLTPWTLNRFKEKNLKRERLIL